MKNKLYKLGIAAALTTTSYVVADRTGVLDSVSNLGNSQSRIEQLVQEDDSLIEYPNSSQTLNDNFEKINNQIVLESKLNVLETPIIEPKKEQYITEIKKIVSKAKPIISPKKTSKLKVKVKTQSSNLIKSKVKHHKKLSHKKHSNIIKNHHHSHPHKKGAFSIDLNTDGLVDQIDLLDNGKFTQVYNTATGKSIKLSTNKVREDLLKALNYSNKSHINNGKIPSSYILTENDGDKQIIKYLIRTNDVSGIENKLTNALEVVSIADIIANADVRSEYLRHNLIKEIKANPSLIYTQIKKQKESSLFFGFLPQLSKSKVDKKSKGTLSGHIVQGKPLKGIRGHVRKTPKLEGQVGYTIRPSLTFDKKSSTKIQKYHKKQKGLESMIQNNLDSNIHNKVAYQILDNVKEREIYAQSFGDDTSLTDLLIAFGPNSAILSTIQADYLPTIQTDNALAKSRGANMNTYVTELNNANKKQLPTLAIKVLKRFEKMYKSQIEATKLKVENLKRF